MAEGEQASCKPRPLSKQSEVEVDEELSVLTVKVHQLNVNDRPTLSITRSSQDKIDTAAKGTSAGDTEFLPNNVLQSDGFNGVQKGNNPRLKVLTRGEAVQDDSSPPPLAETEINEQSVLKATKKLSKSGSQSSFGSLDTGSPALSRDSSCEVNYTDSTGIDLEEFIKKTINKNVRDRQMLLKLEQDLSQFIHDSKQSSIWFGPHSSYNRMLVHRVAAFFGLDHNIDQSGKCVVLNRTANTRVPDFSFRDHISELTSLEAPEGGKGSLVIKKIEKRDNKSDCDRLGSNMKGMGKKSKSIEEREKEYTEIRKRIFTDLNSTSADGALEVRDIARGGRTWSSTESSTGSSGYGSVDCERIPIMKANSFGGVVSIGQQKTVETNRQLNNNSSESAATCSNSTTRTVSPSSSKTLPSSLPPLLNEAVTVLPDGQQVLWVATPVEKVPMGSHIFCPSAGQVILNADGSLYSYPTGGQWAGTISRDLPPGGARDPVIASQPLGAQHHVVVQSPQYAGPTAEEQQPHCHQTYLQQAQHQQTYNQKMAYLSKTAPQQPVPQQQSVQKVQYIQYACQRVNTSQQVSQAIGSSSQCPLPIHVQSQGQHTVTPSGEQPQHFGEAQIYSQQPIEHYVTYAEPAGNMYNNVACVQQHVYSNTVQADPMRSATPPIRINDMQTITSMPAGQYNYHHLAQTQGTQVPQVIACTPQVAPTAVFRPPQPQTTYRAPLPQSWQRAPHEYSAIARLPIASLQRPGSQD